MGPSTSTHRPAGRARAGRLRLLAVLVLALALALLAGGAANASAAVPQTLFGLSVFKPTGADYTGMANVGAGSVRVIIPWGSVQPKRKGGFHWGGIDALIDHALDAGLRPLPILYGAPRWATGSKEVVGPVKRAKAKRGWQDFVTAALERYGPGSDLWGPYGYPAELQPDDWLVWNEQNAVPFWSPKASPKQYAKLLKLTRKAADTVAPEARLIVGGMYGFPKNNKSMPAKKFLAKLYKQRGTAALIDGVSVHPYAKNVAGVRQQTVALRKVMDRAGDRDATLIVGEVGWASGGPKRSILVKTPKVQAKLLTKAYKMFIAKRKAWGIESVYWYDWRDYRKDIKCPWCPKAGLAKRNGKLKPAGKAFKRLAARSTAAGFDG